MTVVVVGDVVAEIKSWAETRCWGICRIGDDSWKKKVSKQTEGRNEGHEETEDAMATVATSKGVVEYVIQLVLE